MPQNKLKNMSIVDELGEFLYPNGNAAPILVRGEGAEVIDDEGNRYIDLEGGPGVVSVGHCHPKVVSAVRNQAGMLMQSPGRFHSPLALKLARRISDAMGSIRRRVFFANSGAEANDGAIKTALKHGLVSGRRGFGIFALEHGFHGRLSLPLSLTGMAARKKGFGPYATFPGVIHLPAPYCYRCPFGETPEKCGLKCADTIENAMKTSVPGEAAVLIAEPILGVGGVIVPPDGYWRKIQETCLQHNITLIHDEVFTGFGRTGKIFAHHHWDVTPQIISFAKAIGGGVPLGGFAVDQTVAASIESGDHFTTFGSNNQIGLAAGGAVLDIIADENLVERAAAAGVTFKKGLFELQRKFKVIGEVRGMGLMIGVELVLDRTTKAPATEAARAVAQLMSERGVLVPVTGVHGCVIRITPPLILTDAQIGKALETLEAALAVSAKASGM